MYNFFYRAKEAGKTISAGNLKKIQSIHDVSGDLGAVCGGSGMYESARSLEAALPMNTSHDALRGHLRTALMTAHGVSNTYDSMGPWISDVFPQHVVYSHGGDTFKRKYDVAHGAAGTNPKVTLGDAKKVHTAYVDSGSQDKESMRLLAEVPEGMEEAREAYDALVAEGGTRKAAPVKSAIIALPEGTELATESVIFFPHETLTVDMPKDIEALNLVVREASKRANTIPICIIKPGWGSCAFYSKEMIKNTGPAAFTKGTQMFVNHATESEEASRPEGDMNQLAAVLSRDAYWNENGPKGPALYSEAVLFSDHADKIMEKGPYTGCSINAAIKATEGSAEGRSGRIAEAFVKAYSIDFVTKAGAGGAPIVPVTESATGGAPSGNAKEQNTMDDKEIAALRTERDQLAQKVRTMESQQNKIVAMATVGGLVKEAGFTFKQSLLERVCESPKMTSDGKVDAEWAKAVAADLCEVGESGGRVTNMGDVQRTREAGVDKETKESLSSALSSLGVPEAGLAFALGDK